MCNKMPWTCILVFSMFFFGLSFDVEGATKAETEMQKAVGLYNSGNCKAAIPMFKELIKGKQVSQLLLDEARFKLAYCEHYIGNYKNSKNGFKKYLKKYPDNIEARLKISEAFYELGQYKSAIKNVKKVTDPNWSLAARILQAKANMGLKKNRRAIKILRSIKNAGDWQSQVDYWIGVAYYNLDETDEAEKIFTKCYKSSPKDSWTKSASKDWLDTIESERTDRFNVYLTTGFFYDGNVNQSSATAVAGSGAAGQRQTNKRSDEDADEVTDTGYLAGFGFGIVALDFNSFQLSTSFDASTTTYQAETDSNYESMTSGVNMSLFPKDSLSWYLGASYTDTRYDWDHYKDYLTIMPGLSWEYSSQTTIDFSLENTKEMQENGSSSGANLSASWDFSSFALWSGFLVSTHQGDKAVFDGDTVTDGTIFSNYQTVGANVGVGFPLFFDVYLSTDLAASITSYAKEDSTTVPGPGSGSSGSGSSGPGSGSGSGSGSGGGGPGSGGGNLLAPGDGKNSSDAARKDTTMVLSLSFSRIIIEEWLSVQFDLSYTDNKSEGYQGAPDDDGNIPSNTYTRPYASLGFTLYH